MNANPIKGRRPPRLWAFLAVVLLTLGPVATFGQACRLHVQAANGGRATLLLTLYDADTVPRRLRAALRNGEADFSTTIKGPCYAELSTKQAKQPLTLFVEPGDIQVRYNMDQPEQSAVSGSRTNSQYRYLLEQCPAYESDCLQQALQQNASQVFAPQLLTMLMQHAALPLGEQQALFAQLNGDATSAYPYHLLAARLGRAASLQPGQPLPNLACTTADGKQQPLSAMLDKQRPNLLLVGATWCSQCQQVAARVAKQHPEVNLVSLNLDHEPKGWDAPYMQALAIDHIPFLLLLDANGRIVHYDLREWQLDDALASPNHK